MLEHVRQYFQDWSDACEYANECAPDLSVLGNGEPFTALLFIAGVCYLAYAVNEARIARRLHAGAPASGQAERDLMAVVEKMKQVQGPRAKLAA
jgi:hypothetical protein